LQPKEIGLPFTAYFAVDEVKEVGGLGLLLALVLMVHDAVVEVSEVGAVLSAACSFFLLMGTLLWIKCCMMLALMKCCMMLALMLRVRLNFRCLCVRGLVSTSFCHSKRA